ncbi:MAG: DUF2380 domain-containing protein [Fidelibacterota bacterium]
MKKNIFLFLIIVILTGCSANLLNQRIDFEQPLYKQPDNRKLAVISRFRLDLSGSEVIPSYKKSLEEAIADAIYSTGMYQKVLYGDDTYNGENMEVDKFQVKVIARDMGHYNWFFAWPAIYPMTLTWPIQPYSGIVQVELKISFKNDEYQTSHIISNEKQHGVTFYGFFRKSDVENKIIPLYYTGLDQLRDFVLKVNLENSGQSSQFLATTKKREVNEEKIQWEGDVKNIAILPLGAYAIPEQEVKALSNRLGIELFNTGRFSILERSQMEAILEEQGFQQTGCTSAECAVEAGQLLNVEQMITGSVSRIGRIYSVEVRLIDVETSKILAVGVADIRGGIEEVLTSGMNSVVWNMLE